MIYDVREMKRGDCGRCGAKIRPEYLWCDNCEDLVARETPTSPFWEERRDEEPQFMTTTKQSEKCAVCGEPYGEHRGIANGRAANLCPIGNGIKGLTFTSAKPRADAPKARRRKR